MPCTGIKPFLAFTNPADGQTYYLGGDVNANIPHPNLFGTYIDAIYYNHTRAYYDARGYITPMYPQLGPHNFYPAPSDVSNLCSQWASFGNTATCPGGTATWYTNSFLQNPVWLNSYQFYAPSIAIACNGGPVHTATPPPTATFTPIPQTPTPQAGNPAFTDYVEGLYGLGVTAGCGGGNFCGVQPITREQDSVWLWKSIRPGTPPPPCIGIFNDQPCYTRTPTPTVTP